MFFRTSGAIATLDSRPINAKTVFSLHALRDHLYVRRTDDILRKALHISRPDRNNEVRQLIAVLRSEVDFKILRTDVHAFFESVQFRPLIRRLEAEGFRNHSTLAHLKAINNHLVTRFGYPGLPRGLSISSTLADYTLQHIDRALLECPGTIYYTRYVDDICIVHLGDNKRYLALLTDLLRVLGLTINRKKTLLLEPPFSLPLEYLGYAISLDASHDVSIARRKLDKAKRRIAQTLQAFLANNKPTAYLDLRDRLRFLTSTVELKKPNRQTSVFSGFKHNYKECTKLVIQCQLAELDTFLMGILSSKRYKLGRSVRARLTPHQFAAIRKLSFRAAYDSNIISRFTPTRIATITEAWRYA